MKPQRPTLAAVATAAGDGAVAIVRISGMRAWAIARSLARLPEEMPTRGVWVRRLFHEGALLDEAVVLAFRGPRSFTGEDVVELQVHGGSLNVEAVLDAVLQAGAVVAEPGGFTRRALENGRMDLLQVEGLGALIQASSEAARRLALGHLTGKLSERLHAVTDAMAELLMWLEAAIDFSLEEDVETISHAEITTRLQGVERELKDLLGTWRDGRLRAEGVRVALIGAPNAGKSTTLNTLLGEERALVTPVAGTTRDWIEAAWRHEGLRYVLVDTAGLRETDDAVEALGVERSHAQLRAADVLLLVVDARQAEAHLPLLPLQRDPPCPVGVLFTHLDCVDSSWAPPEVCAGLPTALVAYAEPKEAYPALVTLLAELARQAGWGGGGEAPLLSRARHRALVQRALQSTERALSAASALYPPELIALDVREGLDAVGEMTGAVTTDDVLNRIFEGFCVGK